MKPSAFLTSPTPLDHRAFTFLELLVVMGSVAVLIALLLPALRQAQEKARRTGCLSNLRQLGFATQMYADDDARGFFSDSLADTEDNLNYLHGHYVSETKSFVCPSTRNRVRPGVKRIDPVRGRSELVDLAAYAGSTDKDGMSYEIFAFMNCTPNSSSYTLLPARGGLAKVRGIKKSLTTVLLYRHQNTTHGLQGIVPGPSQIWLINDGDEPPGYQHFPDRNNNHGEQGANIQFCDGHVEWIPAARYLRSYELSQDENYTIP